MTFKFGDMVREMQYRDIGRIIGVPTDDKPYYVVSFDSTKIRYSIEQVASGSLRLLTQVTL